MRNAETVRLGDARVDLQARWIERDGVRSRVDAKAMAVLRRLAETPGEVVEKDAFFAAVWPGRFVGDSVLPVAIRTLRRALGDDARAPRFIETLPRVGYRLVAPVEPDGASPTPAQRPHPRNRRRLGPSALAVLLVASLTAAWLFRDPGGGAAADRPVRVDVLAIEIEGDDPELRRLGERIVDRLVSALARWPATRPGLVPVAESAAGVYLVSGRAHRADDRLVVRLRLTHRVTGEVLWSPILETDWAGRSTLPERAQRAFRRGALAALGGGRERG